jgi:hypothetical protein
MTREDGFIGQLEGYLDEYEGSTPLPDDVRHAIRAQLPSTQQRRLRFPAMNQAMRIALASAAVVAVALLGISFIRGPTVNGPGLGDPTPTAAPNPSPRPLPADWQALEPGTYVAGDPFSLRVTLTLPAGWRGSVPGPYRVDLGWVEKPYGIAFLMFNAVSADPCHRDQGYIDPPPGSSVDDLATALANMPGIEVTDLADVTVDGYSGTQLTISAPDSFAGCNLPPEGYVVWQLPLGWTHIMTPGERDRVWILDVDGERLVIVVQEPSGYTDEQRAEVQEIFNSIQIEGP